MLSGCFRGARSSSNLVGTLKSVRDAARSEQEVARPNQETFNCQRRLFEYAGLSSGFTYTRDAVTVW